MTKTELRALVGGVRKRTQSEINNVAIWTSAAASALQERMKDAAFVSAEDFCVPSKRPDKTVYRSKDAVRMVLAEAVSTKMYWTTLIYLVSLAEDAFLDMARAYLLQDPRRFLIENGSKKIDVSTIITSGAYDLLLEGVADSILHDLSYRKPAEQMEYFQKVFGITFDAELSAEWYEIKATRDILVHNGGIANAIYCQKAGAKARAADGDTLRVERAYFEHVVVTLKSLIGGICSALQRNIDQKPKRA